MTIKREPQAGDLWSVGETTLLLYDKSGAGYGELGNVILDPSCCILGGTQGEDLIEWLKKDGRFLCNLVDVCKRIQTKL